MTAAEGTEPQDSATITAARPGRDLSLDVLRGVAILLVLGRHMPPQPVDDSVLGKLLELWQRGGWVGVDLFFVLSGFLISGLLFSEFQRHGRIDFKRFFIRRGMKIYPAFYLLITVTVAQGLWAAGYVPLNLLLSEVFYLQNYLEPMWNHTWSLATEEHFYILLPATLLGIIATGRKRKSEHPLAAFPWLVALASVACLAMRLVNATRPWDPDTHLAPTHLRIDSLLFGCLISYGYHFFPRQFDSFRQRWRLPLGILGMGLLLPAFLWPIETRFIHTFGLTLFYLGSGMLLVSLLGSIPNNAFARPLAAVGRTSYSIYLWHLPALIWMVPLIEIALGFALPPRAALVTYLCGACLTGAVMARIVEFPVLAARDRWFPSRSNLAVTEAQDQTGLRA